MSRLLRFLLLALIVSPAIEPNIRLAMPLLANPIERAKLHARLRGTYDVEGTRPDGKSYNCTLTIEPSDGDYLFEWHFANSEVIKGTGRVTGDTVVVDWGTKYPAIYVIQSDGVLKGTWENGKGTEILTPQKD